MSVDFSPFEFDDTIVFTQFMFPDGGRKQTLAPMPNPAEEWAPKVQRLLDAGMTFTCEKHPQSQMVTLYVSDDAHDRDIATVCFMDSYGSPDEHLKNLITMALTRLNESPLSQEN
jgi:hypothetical protein